MSDLISRQALCEYAFNQKDKCVTPNDIMRFPSAQPDPCVDTIDALNESIKHFDDMAEECRRNANIERNDYMDMRDDAAEYRQLSTWLNELRWLRERFQSQPERKKGKWIKLDMHAHIADHKCTACGQECYVPTCMGEPMYTYCPNCGADMRTEENDDN